MTTELQQKALNNMLKGLQSLGCSYIVVDNDGGDYKYGDAFATKKKKGKRPYGVLRNHYWPFVQDLKPGDTVKVPIGPFTMDEIQSGIAAKLSMQWGPGSFVTTRHAEQKVIEVLRVF
jgi:hypothetical protein